MVERRVSIQCSKCSKLVHCLLHLLHWIEIRESTIFLHYGATCVIVFSYLESNLSFDVRPEAVTLSLLRGETEGKLDT